jgi:hypothetical protein
MFQKLKMASVAIAILFFLLSLLAVLQFYRFQNLLYEVNSSRISVPAQALKRDVERTLAFGLPLQTNVQLKTMLDQVNEKYPSILSIQLVDTIADAGNILWESGPPLSDPMTFVRAQRRSGKPMWFDTSRPDDFIQTWVIHDPIGQVVANLTLSADKSQVTALLAEAQAKLLKVWLSLCIAVLLILIPILLYLFSRLDRIILAAQAILLGKPIEANTWQHSEICELATQIVKSDQTPQNNKR